MYLNRSTDAQDGISVKQNTCTRVLLYILHTSLKNPFSCSYKGLTLLADVFHYAVFGHKLQWIFYFFKQFASEKEEFIKYTLLFTKKNILYKITNDITCI